MLIILSDLVNMCKIEKNLSNEVRKAKYHTKKNFFI